DPGEPGDGGHVHHVGDTAVAQSFFRRPHHLVGADGVDPVNVEEVVGAETVQVFMSAEQGGAGVVDENVETAELIQRGLHQCPAILIAADVRLHHQGFHAEGAAIVGHFLRPRLVTAVVDNHVAAVFGEQAGGGGADAGGRTGDQSDGVFYLHVELPSQ